MTEVVSQTHIPADTEYEQILGYKSERDALESRTGDELTLLLTRGGDITDGELYEGEPLVIQDGENHQRVTVPDPGFAVGYFMHGTETRGIPREVVFGDLPNDLSDKIMEKYSMSQKDKRFRLLDMFEWRTQNGDWAADVYRDVATWRSTGLEGGSERYAKKLLSEVDRWPSMCYRTAQLAALERLDDDRVKYVEGVALPETMGQCIRHAWLEIDGEVAEFTWPSHPISGGRAVYWGVQINKEQVKEKRDRRDNNGPVALTDEQVNELGGMM